MSDSLVCWFPSSAWFLAVWLASLNVLCLIPFNVCRRCILKIGLPDVGWWSANILFYCPLNVSELEKDVNLARKATCTDVVYYIHASSFLFSDILPQVASGKICKKKIQPMESECITRGGGQGAVWKSHCWEYSAGVPELDVYLDMTHLSSLHSGLFNLCQNTWRESDSR